MLAEAVVAATVSAAAVALVAVFLGSALVLAAAEGAVAPARPSFPCRVPPHENSSPEAVSPTENMKFAIMP